MSEDINLDLIITSVTNASHSSELYRHQRRVIPSSTLFFELIEEGDDLLVEAFFNDQPLHLGGCEHKKGCAASDFADFLNKTIAYPDTSKACQISNSTQVIFE